jgi:hypothetical protein
MAEEGFIYGLPIVVTPLHRSDAILRFAFEPVVNVSFMAIAGFG